MRIIPFAIASSALFLAFASGTSLLKEGEIRDESEDAKHFLAVYMSRISGAQQVELDRSLESGLDIDAWYKSRDVQIWKKDYGNQFRSQDGKYARLSVPHELLSPGDVVRVMETTGLNFDRQFKTKVLVFGHDGLQASVCLPTWKLTRIKNQKGAAKGYRRKKR